MSEFDVTIVGTNKVGLVFEQLPSRMRVQLVQRVTALTHILRGRIEGLIHRRTGKLASELKENIWSDNPERVVGQVSISAEFAKAGALEYGGTGRPFAVEGYEITRVAAFGKMLNAPTTTVVQAYSRSIHSAAQRFLRGPLASMSEEINSEIRSAVSEAVDESNQ